MSSGKNRRSSEQAGLKAARYSPYIPLLTLWGLQWIATALLGQWGPSGLPGWSPQRPDHLTALSFWVALLLTVLVVLLLSMNRRSKGIQQDSDPPTDSGVIPTRPVPEVSSELTKPSTPSIVAAPTDKRGASPADSHRTKPVRSVGMALLVLVWLLPLVLPFWYGTGTQLWPELLRATLLSGLLFLLGRSLHRSFYSFAGWMLALTLAVTLLFYGFAPFVLSFLGGCALIACRIKLRRLASRSK
ncbi:hypothetical protein [Gorillibacterium sp. CAU 1737]|uniref:hypothetical protein n=1 Tax=Gorillibacterium sp. CAU 1737 TaxID=3140362 RepID=UPI00326080B3